MRRSDVGARSTLASLLTVWGGIMYAIELQVYLAWWGVGPGQAVVLDKCEKRDWTVVEHFHVWCQGLLVMAFVRIDGMLYSEPEFA